MEHWVVIVVVVKVTLGGGGRGGGRSVAVRVSTTHIAGGPHHGECEAVIVCRREGVWVVGRG